MLCPWWICSSDTSAETCKDWEEIFLPMLWKHGAHIEANQLNNLQIQTVADGNSHRLWKRSDDYTMN